MFRSIALGLLGGAAWGVVARGFMRLLAGEPEFTWSGTLSIIAMATVAGLAVGVVHGARAGGRSRWWRLAGLPFIVIFGGLGALLLPGAVGAALLLGRRTVLRIIGAVLVLGTPILLVVTTDDGPFGLTQWFGLVVMTGCMLVQGAAIVDLTRRWVPRAEGDGRRPATASTLTAAR